MGFDLNRLKAKLIIARHLTFFTSMLYSLECREDTECPTAYTDGTVIGFNPVFMATLREAEQLFVLAHEILHVAFHHLTRRGERTPKRWNRAADYWINHYLVSIGLSMPSCGLYDTQFTHDMSVNEIYDMLPDEAECEDHTMGGDIRADDQSTEAERKEQESAVMDSLIRATMEAEQAEARKGSNDASQCMLPGSLARMISDYLNPQVHWSVVLINYLAAKAQDDYTWSKPNRRYPGMYMPTLYSEGMDRISIYVDCSMSVSDEEFAAEMTEAQSIKDIFNPEEMAIIFFNSEIVSETIFHRDEQLNVELPVSGGTCITPVLTHLIEHPADVAVVFSDGYFYTDDREPDTPLFWCVVDNKGWEYPFGTVLDIEVKHERNY